MARFEVDDWSAGQLRLTAFLGARAGGGAEQLWESVVGGSPDESTSNPKKGASQASGAHEAAKLVLRLEPERLDWLFVPEDLDPESPPADPFFSVGPWVPAIDTFGRVAEKWLQRADLPPIERMAFGSVLLHREPTREAAYERLGDYLPIKPGLDSSDFLYQINHPAASTTGIPDLRVNRLSKWSAGVFRTIGFALTPGRGPTAAVEHAAAYALRVELDINTAPDFQGPIPANRLLDVYRELVAFGREIAVSGPH